jgi:hypothetical protein
MEGCRCRIRPRLETLENRDCPSVTAGVNAGDLIIKATSATSNLGIIETAAGSFQINLIGQTLGTFTGVSGNLRLELSDQNNLGVLINLGGFTTIDNVFVSLGDGTDGLTIENGGIQGRLTVSGGKGVDQVALGGDNNPLIIAGGARISLGSSSADSVTLNSGASVQGDLAIDSADAFTMQAGSDVGGDLTTSGGGGAWVLLDGHIQHDASLTGSRHDDHFTLGPTGSVGHNLTIAPRGGADTIAIDGTVGHDLSIASKGWGGNKDIRFDGSVGRDARIVLGRGNDSVDLNGTVKRDLFVSTGGGADMVNVQSGVTAKKLTVNLGSGDDTLMWNAGATVSGTARLRGDSDSTAPGDTFVTNLSILPKNLHLSGFETKHFGA